MLLCTTKKSCLLSFLSLFGFLIASTAGAMEFRIATFNLYNRPWERKARLQTALETLRELKADIITLQEVATGWILPGDPVSLFESELKLHAARHWHEENLGVFRTGIAVLSRYPIVSSQYHDFKHNGFWDTKGYMLVQLKVPDGILQLVNLHMVSGNQQAVRRENWAEITDVVQTMAARGPVLVAGDFNSGPDDPGMAEFVRINGAASLYDGRKDLSELRSWTLDYRNDCHMRKGPDSELLDYIFVVPDKRPAALSLKILDGRIVDPGRKPNPSDHCAVTAQVRWLGR